MKTTVNLEIALRKQRKNIVTPIELLAVEQFDKLDQASVIAILDRSGFTGAYKTGKEVKSKLQNFESTNATFPPDKIYHISQIKKMCNRYRLKFLPTALYKGNVPENLGAILVQHEMAYNFKLDSAKTFIMAPPSSFNLQSRPKDPLVFHKINDEYYFLMHKWGNDLSIFRRLLNDTVQLTGFYCAGFIACLLAGYLEYYTVGSTSSGLGTFCGCALIWTIIFLVGSVGMYEEFKYNEDTK